MDIKALIMDIRQTPEYANYMRAIGWKVEMIGGVYVFIKRIPLIGNFIKIQRPRRVDLKIINRLTKKYRVWMVVVEPRSKNDELRITNNEFRILKNPYLPSKTLVLDLRKSERELLREMRKSTRREIVNSKVKICNSEVPEKFRDAWKKSVPRGRHVPSLKDLDALKRVFAEKCLFLMEESGSAGAVFLRNKSTAHYWYAFTGKSGKKSHAQHSILWEGIKWAKINECVLFDFEGIYDERFPNEKWRGFSFFKKGFGGKEKEYPGAFVKRFFWRRIGK